MGIIEDLIGSVSEKEIKDFVISKTSEYDYFKNDFLIEFAPMRQNKDVNIYNEIFKDLLNEFDIDFNDLDNNEDDYYYDDDYDDEQVGVESGKGFYHFNLIDRWCGKLISLKDDCEYKEVILISKALIEELAEWSFGLDQECYQRLDPVYLSLPFDTLTQLFLEGHLDANELFDYCKHEMEKEKYNTELFSNLFAFFKIVLSAKVDRKNFIPFADAQLAKLDSSNHDMISRILMTKVSFFLELSDYESVMNTAKDNLHVSAFINDLLDMLVEKKEFSEAKKIIRSLSQRINPDDYPLNLEIDMDQLLIKIAVAEGDVDEIRRLCLMSLIVNFRFENYITYKSSYPPQEWSAGFNRLIQFYNDNSLFYNENLLEIFQFENHKKGIIDYLSAHCSSSGLGRYHRFISNEYPAETLELFRLVIDQRIMDNTKQAYESVIPLFKLMIEIKGGTTYVKQLLETYLTQYKRRHALVKVFNEFKESNRKLK